MSPPTRPRLVAPLAIPPRRHDTPQSPIPSALARQDASSVLRRLDDIEGKVDTLIAEDRVNKHDGETLKAAISHLRGEVSKLATKDQLQAHDDRVSDVMAQVLTMSASLETLTALVGKPPQKLDERVSQQGQHTDAELAEMEEGTGIAGTLGRLAAQHKRLARRVLIGAALGTAIPTTVIEIIKAAIGG